MTQEDIRRICTELTDKNGNHIDLNELAGVYESKAALKAFFRNYTNYSYTEIEELSAYIDGINGNDYGFMEASKVRKRLEERACVKPRKVNHPENKSMANLVKGESFIATCKMSPYMLVSAIIILVVSVIILLFANKTVGQVLAIFCAIWTFIELFRIQYTELYVTNKRIVGSLVWPKRITFDVPLTKVNSIVVTSPSGGRDPVYGTITVNTSSENYEFKLMSHPVVFRETVMAAIEQNDEERMKRQAMEIAAAMRQ